MNTIDLGKELESAFNAISVLLAFVTVFFGMRYPQIMILLEKELPMGRPKELGVTNKRLTSFLIFQWSPVIFLTGISWYILMPLFIRVATESSFSLLHFDLLRTALVFVWLLFLAFLLGSIFLAVKLFIKIHKCK